MTPSKKQFRDPIYGYIQIDTEIVHCVIDTDIFQRLRDVVQTSYSPLYASAVHNRFVHSMGVYHLGTILTNSLRNQRENLDEIENLEQYFRVFELACLLHDVGHAPFSHIGEMYYLDKGDRSELHKEICHLTGDDTLRKEIESEDYKAAAHELMSVIVALKQFPEQLPDPKYKGFFARCILGYPYVSEITELKSFLNCMISFLNSAVIDVDKLDYLIRDAFITGYDAVNIDYVRLLNHILIKKGEGGHYHVLYAKGAISVIENVVYAHDAERKWIQNHPVVQYEIYLLQDIFGTLIAKYFDSRKLPYDLLTPAGQKISDGYSVSLLSDSDVNFLMKNMSQNPSVKEYFSRKDRRHPLWKSEAEYRAFFSIGINDETITSMVEAIEQMCKYLLNLTGSSRIDKEALEACDKDILETEKYAQESKQEDVRKNLQSKREHRAWLKIFEDFAGEQGIPLDFVMISASRFNSGFVKEAFGNLKIDFPGLNGPCNFKDVTNVLSAKAPAQEKFFYFFYRKDPSDEERRVDLKRLASMLSIKALGDAYQKQ